MRTEYFGRKNMGRIAGIRIKNYGSLKEIKMGKLLFDSKGKELTNNFNNSLEV